MGLEIREDPRGFGAILYPSRLTGAFPDGVAVRRVGIKDAIEVTRAFLSDGTPGDT